MKRKGNARGQVAPVPAATRFAFTNKQRPSNMVPIFNKLYLITLNKKKNLIIILMIIINIVIIMIVIKVNSYSCR